MSSTRDLITQWRTAAAIASHTDVAETLVECANELEEATRWTPFVSPFSSEHPGPEPGEYLVALKSGKMQTAKWEHTEFEPAGEWTDPDTDEPLEDYDGQVVAYWRVRPVGPGEAT